MEIKKGKWWEEEFIRIERGYVAKDLGSLKERGVTSGSTTEVLKEANRSEKESLHDLQCDREFLLTRIADCSDLRSNLKREWSERLGSIAWNSFDAEARLIELANDVTEVGDREHVHLLRAFQLSAAQSFQYDLSSIRRRLEKLAAKTREYHHRHPAQKPEPVPQLLNRIAAVSPGSIFSTKLEPKSLVKLPAIGAATSGSSISEPKDRDAPIACQLCRIVVKCKNLARHYKRAHPQAKLATAV